MNNRNLDPARLRQKAEEKLRQDTARMSEDIAVLPNDEIRRMLYELRVHQIELEMQNEELRTAQEELDASRARYFDLYDLAPVGYCTISEKGLILEANLTAATLLNTTRKELVNHPISRFILKEDQDIYYLHRKQVFETGEPQACELRMMKNDSTLFWARLEATVTQDGNTTPVCRIILSDISEHKQAEEKQKKSLRAQLIQARKMEAIGMLAGKISHDFNNILYPIICHTQMMLDDLAEGGSDLRNSLNTVLQASNQARNLVRQILTFSRHAEKEPIPVKIQIIVKEILQLIKASTPSSITISHNIDQDCGMVLADPTKIHQIAMNLITNAIHAMESDGGTLTIELSEVNISASRAKGFHLHPGTFVCFSVSDTGYGIEKPILNRIFEPYFTTKPESKGTGLGLSVVYGIVQSYKGDIRVHSTPGKGTVFNVYLPKINPEQEKVIRNRVDG
jgi:PAS domain S-box-containing protein